jgi:hypothetical protein
VGYGVAMAEALRAAEDPAASEDLKRLQPDLGTYIRNWFRNVVVSRDAAALCDSCSKAVDAWCSHLTMRQLSAAHQELADIVAEFGTTTPSSIEDAAHLFQTVQERLARFGIGTNLFVDQGNDVGLKIWCKREN